MKIYKDIFTGDEVFCDVFPVKEVENGCLLEVKGKLVSETTDTAGINIGANASAEGGDDEACDSASTQSGIDVVLRHRLVETGIDKKGFKAHIQLYMKALKEKLIENEYPDVDKFKTTLTGYIGKVLKDFKDYQFFLGESQNPQGQLIMVRWDGEIPTLYFIKQGLEEEKV